MTDQELIQELRTHAEWAAGNEWETPLMLGDDLTAAADRIANQNTHIAALQKAIEDLRRQMPRWIPVTERLPEVWRNDETAELVNYMIYSPDFGVDIGNYHAKAKKWLCMALPCTVTHWAPLPEPPEENANAETK